MMTSTKGLKNITIITDGYRGDVEPFIAIAIELKRRGYNPRIISSERFKSLADSFDVPFISVGTTQDNELKHDKVACAVMQDDCRANWRQLVKSRNGISQLPKLQKTFQDLTGHCPDLIIAGPLSHYAVAHAAMKMKIPSIKIATTAHFFSSKRPNLSPLKKLFIKVFYIHRRAKEIQRRLRQGDKATGQNLVAKLATQQYQEPPLFLGVSPFVANVTYADGDVEGNPKYVGGIFISAENQWKSKAFFGSANVKQQIKSFLDQGDCICIGWGDVIVDTPPIMAERAVRAARKANQRAIIIGGAAELTMDSLIEAATRRHQNDGESVIDQSLIDYARDNILFVDEAPHEWLFPKVTAIVHHGGSGTTHAALRSGRPMVVTPVWFDQYINAFAVSTLGVGIGFDEKQRLPNLSWQELGDAIETVLTNVNMTKRSKEVGYQLRQEIGDKGAVDAMEQFWEEHVVSGEFERCLIESPRSGYIRPIMMLVMIVALLVRYYM